MTGPPPDKGKRPVLPTDQQHQQYQQGEQSPADSFNNPSSDSNKPKFDYPAHPYARSTDAAPNTDSTTVSPNYQNLPQPQGASVHQPFYGYNGFPPQQSYYGLPSSTASLPMTQHHHQLQQQQQQQQPNQYAQLAPTPLPSSQRPQQTPTTASMILLSTDPLPSIDPNPSPRDEPYSSSQQQFELVTESPEYLLAFYNGLLRQDDSSPPHGPIESQEQMVNTFYKDFQNMVIQEQLLTRQQYPYIMDGGSNATGWHELPPPVAPGSSPSSSSTTTNTTITTTTATGTAATEWVLEPSSSSSTRASTRRGALAERRHGCPNCSRSFTKHHDLVRHYATHIPESKRIMYPCPDCGNVFFRKDSITRHRGTAACQKYKETSSSSKDRDVDCEDYTNDKEKPS